MSMSASRAKDMIPGSDALQRLDPVALKARVALSLGAVLCIVSLLGVSYLTFFYFSQNQRVLEAFNDPLSTYGNASLTPRDLVALSHSVCTLNGDIDNVESFLQPVTDTISKGGWCGNYVRVFILLSQANGYPAHMLHLRSGDRSHTAAEIFYEGEWRVIDPFFNLVYPLPDGELATFADLHRAPALTETPSSGGEFDSPRLERTYRRYQPWLPALYRDANDLDWRLNQSSIYHTVILLINYPLSLLYDGPRRAVVPWWLYRPELLGIYLSSGVFLISATSIVFWGFRTTRSTRANEGPLPRREPWESHR